MSLAESALFVVLGLGVVVGVGLFVSTGIAFLLAILGFWDGMEWQRVILFASCLIFSVAGVWILSNVEDWPWPT